MNGAASTNDWLRDAPPDSGPAVIAIDPADYPDGFIPALTQLRKAGDHYEVVRDVGLSATGLPHDVPIGEAGQ